VSAPTLRLRALGVSFGVEGSRILLPEGYVGTANQSRMDTAAGLALLDICGLRPPRPRDAVPLRVRLALRVRRSGDVYDLAGRQPVTGLLLQTDTGVAEAEPVAVRTPALSIGGGVLADGEVRDGSSQVVYPFSTGATDLIAGAGGWPLPVRLLGSPTAGGPAGISFDLDRWRVRFEANTLRLKLHGRTDAAPAFPFLTTHPSEPFEAPLARTPDAVEVRFANAAGAQGIALHVDWVKGATPRQLLMPMELRGGAVSATLSAHPSGGQVIRGLRAVDGWRLVTYAAGTLTNEPALWNGGAPLELGVRPQIGRRAERAGTLLVRPILRGTPVLVAQPRSGPLHSAIRESRLNPAAPQARLTCERAAGAIPPSILSPIVGIAPELLLLQTLPWIALAAGSEVLISRAGRAYHEGASSAVSPYRLR
jgi:hypothetical protein